MRIFAIFVVGILLWGCERQTSIPQQPYSPDEFQSREGKLDGETFRYRVYVPPNRKRNEPLPVMLYLHGAGNRGNDNESQLNGLAGEIRAEPAKFNFMIVIPQCEADQFWDAKALNKANNALDDTVFTLGGDPQRLYLAGFSLGGFGVWNMAAMFPNKFAAIVPMSGRVIPRLTEIKRVDPEIAKLAEATEPYEAFAERMGSVAVWIFHGFNDNVVPLESSRRMNAALKHAGNTNVNYSEVQGAGHEPLAFRTPNFFGWLSEQVRKN